MAERWIYHHEMQAAIDNNSGMHRAIFVGGEPCGTVCEMAGVSALKGNEPFAYTSDPEQVTCAMCLGVMNDTGPSLDG